MNIYSQAATHDLAKKGHDWPTQTMVILRIERTSQATNQFTLDHLIITIIWREIQTLPK